jgi:hypothetical protein
MDPIIAFCGLVCTDCEGYKATQVGDQAWLERLAEKARVEYGAVNATAQSVMCDGCLSDAGRKCGYCAECQIRACGQARGVANCAYCADYPTCAKIAGFLQMAPAARVTLEGIRAAL